VCNTAVGGVASRASTTATTTLHRRTFASASPVATQFPTGTKLLVCDMAGTTVDEGGAVYVALFEAMVEKGIPMEWAEMHDWFVILPLCCHQIATLGSAHSLHSRLSWCI
jgi:hypothetical protein